LSAEATVPAATPAGGAPRLRYGSPAPGGSILTTSAPKSDITVAAAGPAM